MISPYPVPSLQCLAVQYRLIAALDRLESDCPVRGYPFISEEYRDFIIRGVRTGFLEGVRVAIGACFGVFMIGVAVEGYLFTNVNIFVRLIAVGGALALIDSGITTDLIGLAVLIVIVSWQHFVAKKARQVQPEKAGG